MLATGPNVKNSKWYEDQGLFTLWDAAGASEEIKTTELDSSYEFIRVDNDKNLIAITVESPKLTLRQRAKVLFGKPVPFHLVKTREVTVLEDLDMPLTEEERRAARQWVLANEGGLDGQTKQKTPREQGIEAMDLVTKFPREHNDALIAAIEKLPKANELLIKLKREISPQEKRRIQAIVEAILEKKPVTAKVAL